MLDRMSAGKVYSKGELSSQPLREAKDLVRNLGVPKKRERTIDTEKKQGQ